MTTRPAPLAAAAATLAALLACVAAPAAAQRTPGTLVPITHGALTITLPCDSVAPACAEISDDRDEEGRAMVLASRSPAGEWVVLLLESDSLATVAPELHFSIIQASLEFAITTFRAEKWRGLPARWLEGKADGDGTPMKMLMLRPSDTRFLGIIAKGAGVTDEQVRAVGASIELAPSGAGPP